MNSLSSTYKLHWRISEWYNHPIEGKKHSILLMEISMKYFDGAKRHTYLNEIKGEIKDEIRKLFRWKSSRQQMTTTLHVLLGQDIRALQLNVLDDFVLCEIRKIVPINIYRNLEMQSTSLTVVKHQVAPTVRYAALKWCIHTME